MMKTKLMTGALALLAANVFAATYYVDAEKGNDAASGTSESAAWRSLGKVNAGDLKPDDSVLFRRGGVWRGQLVPQSGMPGKPVRYSNYGKGPKPALQQSVDASGTNSWVSANVKGRWELWATDPSFTNVLDRDVGNVICDGGERQCVKKWRFEDVKGQLDYWYDATNRRVVVKFYKNPADEFASIELAKTAHVVSEGGKHDVVYDGLTVRYGAAHGFGGGDVAGITIRNCDVCWIGGGLQHWKTRPDGTAYPVRYGNGIEFWCSAKNCLVERNRVWEIYDAALTVQGRADDPAHPSVETDIVWRDNVIWNAEYSFEYWNRPAFSKTANVVFEHNTCVQAGFGWGHSQRPDPNGAHLMFYANAAPTAGFIVRNNLFCRSTDRSLRMDADWRTGLTLDRNLWWFPGDWDGVKNGIFQCGWEKDDGKPRQYTCGEKEFARFRKETGFEADGVWGEPQFTDAARNDYRLWPATAGTTGASDGGPFGARGMPGLDEDPSLPPAERDGAPLAARKAGAAVLYPVPPEIRSDRWAVTVEGVPCDVAFARAKYHAKYDLGGVYAFASFETTGPVRLTVKTLVPRDLSQVTIQPARAPVTVRKVDADTLELALARPCKFTVEPSDDRDTPLFVFANTPETDVPDCADPKVKVFGPGLHRVPGNVLKLKSDETLYLKPGAVLQAAVQATGENIRVCGRGIIDGSVWPRGRGRSTPQYSFVNFHACRNVRLEDVTLRGSFHWTIQPENCDGVTVRNVKICGDRVPNDDGIDPCNVRGLLIDDCFFRTEDDCVAVKGMNLVHGPCENITVTNSMFWCDFARIILLGHESRAAYMRHVRFTDCDVLHYVRPVFLLEPGEDMELSDVRISDVRVHTDTHPRTEATMRIQPVVNEYMSKQVPGRIKDVVIENISFAGAAIPLRFLVQGKDREHMTENVTLRNITFNGTKLTQRSSARVDGTSVDTIWFDGGSHPGKEDPAFKIGPYSSGVSVEPAANASAR